MSQHDYIVPHCSDAIELCYRDADLLIVNKPAGLLSVPGRHPDNRDCLISRLQRDNPDARIVHRLDMATSGLMVVALHADSHRALSRLFAQRQVSKEYRARVEGRVEADSGAIDLPLACDWPNRPRQHINFQWGKPAQTLFETVDRQVDCTDLKLMPVTGRSHQLRVHCASIGHPIRGCEFYAPEAVKCAAPRLLLHASSLAFQQPLTGEPLAFASPPPF